ncbi:MAG: hypothetical protein K8T10_05820 [Candidatus Eremiobacteraeota bacterium]|nr:hypothetical protein [Candidatus Eremiobacteraeota bacterium]
MQISIETRAMRIFINTLLSCRCPVSQEVEKEIVDLYLSGRDMPYIDFTRVLEIAGKMNNETPFHRLKEFMVYNINDMGQELFITLDDIYRHFCTKFHWRIVEKTLFLGYKNIIDIPSWFVGHMLLPVVIKREKGKYMAEYTFGNRIINLKSIFVPEDMNIEQNMQYAIHFASVVTPLGKHDFKMISLHLEEINLFRLFRENLESIDYSDFQRFGDFRKVCENRYSKYFNT